MFEGFLEKFLLKYFGEYLCGIDKTNLSIAVWKGEINVRTVDINPEILKKLSLPLRLVFGRVDSLVLRVPWKNLSSSPVEVSIESISLVLALEDLATWFHKRNYLELCNALLDAIQDEMTRKIEEESDKKDDKATFFESIFDNLVVSVRNIHIRVECPFNPHNYVFGAVLEDFSLRSVDSEGKPIFVKRASKTEKVTKLVRFNNLQLYHDSKIQTGRNINLIEYFFKSTKADGHQIMQLDLDVIFSVEPYSPGATKPVYQVATDIASISTTFEPGTIRDFAHFVEYLGAFKQCKLE